MKKQKTGWKLLLVLTMLVMCVGCGAKKNTSGSVSMYDLRTAMEAADPDLPEMLNASSAEKDAEDKFSNISDMDYVISAESPSCSIASQQDETGELNRTSNSFFTVKYSAYKHTEYYRQTENSPIFYFTKGAVG